MVTLVLSPIDDLTELTHTLCTNTLHPENNKQQAEILIYWQKALTNVVREAKVVAFLLSEEIL